MSQPALNSIRTHTISLGCPKNRVDTERLLGALGSAMVPVEEVAEADLVLINTCGFIQPATEESISTILDAVRDAAEALEDTGKKPLICVAGCLVSRYGQDLKEGLPEVDLWLNTEEIGLWPAMAAKALAVNVPGGTPRSLSTGPSYAYLKVSEGCSHNCRFCTIPSIRGPHKSWSVDFLINEARLLADQVAEIIVVGQDSTAYGSDLSQDQDLATLVKGLSSLSTLQWLRIMYLYPAGLTEPLLSLLKETGPPFLPYFDIPLQHAHPDVLSAMGRPFARDPKKVVDRVRSFFPEAALRTTFIVGYPGETDAQFQALMDFVEQTRFHHLGVFPYWPEEGTPAAAMDNQIPDEIKIARRDSLMELQAGISADILSGYVGETLPVLIEQPSDEWPGLYIGRAWFQAPDVDGVTYVSAPPDTPLELGTIVEVEIDKADTYDLSGLV
ncbi:MULTISPECIES: 30S ribosomal protein S12 methylthiotransferase RimO [unclassified Pseudodesulfovibrio]|uniref:30S ribosomal protein S12 methylthiotransferase RimO n=1 Tax=unclassified Pseudodesulfovibrio TaxID=2661612 RepID=UPI000FEC0BE5|nr:MULTISPECIES: 30S ribosomal protein S12 methylthiotransferase RimO [unclassified Pseudodesulfovibrio]MCJ2165715.1 30S ribosomal protein S12 methylthiotransferase RimO [Pseudodesulfovibrio sp. S3-i]RWU02975.1 30S ribosomal protein S12 methylthiotransferase RimO [Pseudodesulfovibrio sp. S3]